MKKNLYLHFQNTYGHQTWQVGNLLPEDPTYLVRWPCDEKYKTLYLHFCNIYDHQTWQNGSLRLKDSTQLVMWPFDKMENFVIVFPQYLEPQNSAEY